MAAPNKQPIFADGIILEAVELAGSSIDISAPLTGGNSPDTLYTCSEAEGVIIERITMIPPVSDGGTVTNDIAYIFVNKGGGGWITYKSSIVASIIVTVGIDNTPVLEFNFSGGVLLNTGDLIGAGSTRGIKYYTVTEGGRFIIIP